MGKETAKRFSYMDKNPHYPSTHKETQNYNITINYIRRKDKISFIKGSNTSFINGKNLVCIKWKNKFYIQNKLAMLLYFHYKGAAGEIFKKDCAEITIR